LRETPERNSIVRKLQIIKLRGQDSVPGLHTFRITDAGVQAFCALVVDAALGIRADECGDQFGI
jgi:hypothetical protein